MAVEAKRGCGYRKVGGLYLVSGRLAAPCGKFPIELSICPCCGGGIKQTRGWTWVNPKLLIGSRPCMEGTVARFREAGHMADCAHCPAADPSRMGERCGLLWIGRGFYKSSEEFTVDPPVAAVQHVPPLGGAS